MSFSFTFIHLRLIASLATAHSYCAEKSSKLPCYYQFIVQHLVSCLDGFGNFLE